MIIINITNIILTEYLLQNVWLPINLWFLTGTEMFLRKMDLCFIPSNILQKSALIFLFILLLMTLAIIADMFVFLRAESQKFKFNYLLLSVQLHEFLQRSYLSIYPFLNLMHWRYFYFIRSRLILIHFSCNALLSNITIFWTWIIF